MDVSQPYLYSKPTQRLPEFLSFACKKSDVDGALTNSKLNVPLAKLRFTKHGGVKKNKIDEKILVALGILRNDGPTLTLYSVPRDLAGTIRSLLKEHGLSEILAKFRNWNCMPETWRQTEPSFELWFNSKTSEMTLHDA